MQHLNGQLSRRHFLAGAGAYALAFAGVGLLRPSSAWATPLSDSLAEQTLARKKVLDARMVLEVAADDYQLALEGRTQALAAVREARANVASTQAEVERLQARLAHRMTSEYRVGQLNLMDTVFGSNSFDEFATRLELMERLAQNDAATVEQAKALREQLAQEETEASRAADDAADRLAEAKTIREHAEQTIAECEAAYDALTAESQRLLEEEQAAALAAQEAAQNINVEIIGNPKNIAPHPSEFLEYALSRMGCPYVWAAAGPDTFDCSGLVVWAAAQAGMGELPHYTGSLYELAAREGAVLPLADALPGDVLFRPGHCGIAEAAGGWPYVHAPHTGAVVRDTDSAEYAAFVCALRFPVA